jgi:tetratricopeptide (TPR) repeat protein
LTKIFSLEKALNIKDMHCLKITIVIILTSCLILPLFAFDNWVELHDRADQITSVQAFEELQEDPDSLEAKYVLALTYLDEHNKDKAQPLFIEILEEDPSNIAAQWGAADIVRRNHDLDEAKKQLMDIIAKDKTFAPAYISLSYLTFMQADFNGSLRYAIRARKRGRKNIDLNNYKRAYLMEGGSRGMLSHYSGPFSKMIHAFKILPTLHKAEKLKPDDAEVYYGLGGFYFLAPKVLGGNLDKALYYLKKAIKADPLFVDPYVRLAQVYRNMGNEDKYNVYLGIALRLDPKNELAVDVKTRTCKFLCEQSPDE